MRYLRGQRSTLSGRRTRAQGHHRRGGHRDLRLTLSGTIPWDIEVAQGAVRLTADLADAPVRSFNIRGGASRIDVRLGQPSGVVPW